MKGMFKFFYKDEEGEPFDLLDYQVTIANAIYLREHKRVIIRSPTRAGKSYIIALAALLVCMKEPNFNVKIVSPTYKHSRIIMKYIFRHLLDNDLFIANLPFKRTELETLGKQLSQQNITFLNSSSVEVLSAEGSGERLMGFGGDMVIVDESPLVDDEVYRTKILRMLGDSTESILIEIGNPIVNNHFYENFSDPLYHKIHITWQDCVREGRFSQAYVDEQRDKLLPNEFKRLYDAEFVLDADDMFFNHSQIDGALKREITLGDKKAVLFGIDLARFGMDWTVVSVIETDGSQYVLKEFKKWAQSNLMETTGKIMQLIEEYRPSVVRIDESGLGGGVIDRLKEKKIRVTAVNFGGQPRDTVRFMNVKAEAYTNLHQIFTQGRIRIVEDSKLVKQLLTFKYAYSSEGIGKMKMVDNQEKSPDESDSLVIGLYRGRGESTPVVFGSVDLMAKAKQEEEIKRRRIEPIGVTSEPITEDWWKDLHRKYRKGY